MTTEKTTPSAVAERVRYARGAWTLSGHVRRRLRECPSMTRAELRDSLRAARLLSWGTLGGVRLRMVLIRMADAGELVLDGETITAAVLLERKPQTPEAIPPAVRKRREKAIRDSRAARRMLKSGPARETCQWAVPI